MSLFLSLKVFVVTTPFLRIQMLVVPEENFFDLNDASFTSLNDDTFTCILNLLLSPSLCCCVCGFRSWRG